MAITRQKKEEVVARAGALVSASKTLVFAKFKGLSVEEQHEMRSAFRKEAVGYTVIKKTLLKRALDAGKFGGTMPALEGEVALAYSEDELAPARELAVFVKKFPEHLAFAGGVFGGTFVSAEEIKSIAAIPGMQTLRAQFVQLINSPRQRLAVVLNAKAEKDAA